MNFNELLNKEFIILDGAMGTVLQKSGVELGKNPEVLNYTHEQLITNIHSNYIKAGSDIIYANTFGANRYKLRNCKYSVEELVKKGIDNARMACKGTEALVALDIGPIGALIEPLGEMSVKEVYDIYKEIVLAGKEADIIVFETMTDLLELKTAVIAAKENSKKTIICTMTFEENLRTFTGTALSSMAVTIEGLGVDAIGINCSLGPKEAYKVVEELLKWTSLPIVVKPNAGLPNIKTGGYDISPEEFASYMKKLVGLGVKFLGGCCGTDTKYIELLKEAIKHEKYKKPYYEKKSLICSNLNTVCIDKPLIIGERINPTGKKLFKQALIEEDIDYIVMQGIEQVNANADILDVNVGLPEINEEKMMEAVIMDLQSVIKVPLQIDSSDPSVIESALRVYNGKPIINSVNGTDSNLKEILPIVKKYGASIIGLTIDESGVPKTAQKRLEIAKKILNKALEYGIKKEDIYIDCLTLTVSAHQEEAMETLKALTLVKKELGLKTVLGVSNISFGLMNREMINYNFLAMALYAGLDLAIINPNIPSMMDTIRTYRVLANMDKNALEFIDTYKDNEIITNTKEDNEINISENLNDKKKI